MLTPAVQIRQESFGAVRVLVAHAEGAPTWAVNLRDSFGVGTEWAVAFQPRREDLREMVLLHVRASMGVTRRN